VRPRLYSAWWPETTREEGPSSPGGWGSGANGT
jgi:hypothetical protein